jgi:hypothetical protein
MNVLTRDEIYNTLKQLIPKAKKEIIIVSPWIKGNVLQDILSEIKSGIQIKAVIRTSETDDLLITDQKVFEILKDKNGELYGNKRIHAKFVIIDEDTAVISSSNITNAGLFSEEGNLEGGVLVSDKEEISKLKNYFQEIVLESIDIFNSVGFVLNSINSRTIEAVIFEDIPEQTYLKINTGENSFLLGRISSIKKLNLSVFSSDDNFVFRNIFSSIDELKSILINSSNKEWQKSALLSYLNENKSNLSIAEIEILAEFNPGKIKEKESILKTPLQPVEAGKIISFMELEKELVDLVKINHSGYPMGNPIKFGKLFNTELPAYIDLDKIVPMHMAVLGVTGSGKTTFVRRVLENIPKNNISVYIIDIFGEYYDSLNIPKKNMKHFRFKNSLFPLTADDLKKIFKVEGIVIQEKTTEEKKLIAFFRENLKPDISINALKDKTLEDLILEAVDLLSYESPLKSELITFLDVVRRDYGDDSLLYQPEIVKSIEKSLTAKEQFVIFDFKNIDDPDTRINIAGLIMKEIFRKNKSEEGKKHSLLILEEAQNFAPEKGLGEVPASTENISFIMSRKIATEGRKFNLGLVAITQRPASISKYVLSQLNTQVVFKLINKNDLDSVSAFFEKSKEDIFELLPFLKPGSCFITGLGVPFGIVVEIKLG